MNINRKRAGAASMIAMLALMGFGTGIVSAADPATGAAETGIETAAETTETTGVEADGLGGHADAPGVDVNHDFQGQE